MMFCILVEACNWFIGALKNNIFFKLCQSIMKKSGTFRDRGTQIMKNKKQILTNEIVHKLKQKKTYAHL
jgi:hypothetical protein